MIVLRTRLLWPFGLILATALSSFASPADQTVTYSAHGRVVQIDSSASEVVVMHQAIGDYMPAMTMPFRVREPNLLNELKAGDVIDFELHVDANLAWIDHVITKAHIAPELNVRAVVDAGVGRELKEGDAAPDIELVFSNSERSRLSQLRGQSVAITFIYTRCPLPTYCPLVNKNFSAAQALIRRIEPGYKYKFVSITLDPAHDSTAVMKDVLRQYSADRAHWDFASTNDAALRLLGDAVGLEYRVAANGSIDHNLRTVVVDSAGRIQKIFRGNSWTAQELVAEMIRARS